MSNKTETMRSLRERQVQNYLDKLGYKTHPNYRKFKFLGTQKNFEVDLFLPERNIAFEFNGYYWHSSKFHNPNYHIDKRNSCLLSGVRLYSFWENLSSEALYENILDILGRPKPNLELHIKQYAKRWFINKYRVTESAYAPNGLTLESNDEKPIASLDYHCVNNILTIKNIVWLAGYSNKLKVLIDNLVDIAQKQNIKEIRVVANSDRFPDPNNYPLIKYGFNYYGDLPPTLVFYANNPFYYNRKLLPPGVYSRHRFEEGFKAETLRKAGVYTVHNSGRFLYKMFL